MRIKRLIYIRLYLREQKTSMFLGRIIHAMRIARLGVALGVVLSVAAGSATATEPPESMARQLFSHYETASRVPAPAWRLGLIEAAAVQTAYLELLTEAYGTRMGYKAGLTGTAAQRRFGVDHPLLGMLFAGGYQDAPGQLGVDVGARLLVEADLVVRVADAAINSARDWSGLLANLDVVYPFVEVPDLLYATDVSIDAPLLLAANVGARAGVLGAPIPLSADEDWHRRLAQFQVRMVYADGGTAHAQGQDLLGHPLAVVEWIRDAVLARGEQLQPGDLLSLGSLTPPRPVQPGRVAARYEGLDPAGPVTITLDVVPAAPQLPLPLFH